MGLEYNMEAIVQWATILSPVVAVLLAWWTSKSSIRATKKQIASIKELEKMQINLLQLQLDKELSESHIRYSQASEKVNREYSQRQVFNYIGGFADSMRHIQERKQDNESERDFHSERMKWLRLFQQRLDEMKKQVK